MLRGSISYVCRSGNMAYDITSESIVSNGGIMADVRRYINRKPKGITMVDKDVSYMYKINIIIYMSKLLSPA